MLSTINKNHNKLNFMLDVVKQISKKLKELNRGKTQREFAKELGIDVATLNRLENKCENITLKTIQRMCDHLNCNVAFLFGEEDKKK